MKSFVEKPQANIEDIDAMAVIKSVWQKYDKDGQGYLNQIECRHFVEKYLKINFDVQEIPEKVFQEWYKELNKNG